MKNDALHKCKERVRETSGSNANNRYVSRFEPLALHPRLHHRVGFPIHYLPPREPLPKRIYYNNGVPNSSLKQPPHNRGVGPKPIQLNHNHLYRRGIQTPLRSTFTKEGYTNKGGFTTWRLNPVSYTHLTLPTIYSV